MVERGIFDLSGKVALITGGGSGIGRAYCEAMAEFGADVACCDIVEEKAQETVGLLARFGHRAIAIKADASQPDEIKYMVNRTVEELGTIDIVFANAGIGDEIPARIHEKPVEDWDKVMALQPRGTFLLMQAVFPIMMNKRGGSFISTASIGGITPTAAGGFFDMLTAYNSAKAAVIMLTKMAARQYGEYGIRVTAICPGYIRTAMTSANEELRVMAEGVVLNMAAVKRIAVPDDIKGLAVWLASDASSFATGHIFVQDGGMIT